MAEERAFKFMQGNQGSSGFTCEECWVCPKVTLRPEFGDVSVYRSADRDHAHLAATEQ